MNDLTRTVLSVTELAETLRGLLEQSLPSVWVEGELSNFRSPGAHWYFTLKDAQSAVRCAMFRSANHLVRPVPKDGDAVLLRGKVTFYPKGGDAQIVVEHLEPAGEGVLLRAFEALKKKLAAEGLFDAKAKRPIPEIPRGIGIVTSPTGAALQDILTTLRRRFPLGTAYLYPVPVQGDTAAPAIVKALRELPDLAPVDVILLARGGGSLEDLWAFNDERIARAIRACSVPVVTGVGHEIDFTIADFAADLRAPTPTGAAERVSPDVAEWHQRLGRAAQAAAHHWRTRLRDAAQTVDRLDQRLRRTDPRRRLELSGRRLAELATRFAHAVPAALQRRAERVESLRLRLRARDPGRQLALLRQRLAAHGQALAAGLPARLRDLRQRSEARAALLRSLGPRAVLERGYAIARTGDGVIVRDAAAVPPGTALEVLLARGRLGARVERSDPEPGT